MDVAALGESEAEVSLFLAMDDDDGAIIGAQNNSLKAVVWLIGFPIFSMLLVIIIQPKRCSCIGMKWKRSLS
jgi:hypothetical protein